VAFIRVSEPSLAETTGRTPSEIGLGRSERILPHGPSRTLQPGDRRLVAGIRLLLAAAGFLVASLVSPETPDRGGFVIALLVAYTIYAGVFLFFRPVRGAIETVSFDWEHWADTAWFLTLITLSGGTNSIFFYGLFFPIMVASFRWGFAAGMRVTLVSAILFVAFGYLAAPPEPTLELQRFVIRPVFLISLGYMMASRGGFEVKLRTRLEFLKDIGSVTNPRFGIDRSIGVMIHRVMRLYGADGCAMITTDAAKDLHEIRHIRRDQSEGAVTAAAIPAELADRLLRFPERTAIEYSKPDHLKTWPIDIPRGRGRVPPDPERWEGREASELLANALEADSFVGVPFDLPNQGPGWLWLAFEGKRVFDEWDVGFLLQIVEHAIPVVENIRLADRLASSAAEEERKRIARDIHDSVIQPYVGLRIGLAGLRQKVHARSEDAGVEIERLIEMTAQGIDDLRRQVSTLRWGGGTGEGLVPAVRRFAAKFTEATGIAVDVVADGDAAVSERIAGEAFQMVAEGLSNVRRHSSAARAIIRIVRRNEALELSIENEGGDDAPFVPFLPRSIKERAEALGGLVRVRARNDGGTVVNVEIPL
jgi:signal transduction histidine kinase